MRSPVSIHSRSFDTRSFRIAASSGSGRSGLDLHTVAVSSAYLGAALGVIMVLPQIVRVARDPARGGVSALSWALTAMSCFTWLLYGVRAREIPQIPGNVLMICGAVLIVMVVPAHRGRRWRAVTLATAALSVVALTTVLATAAVGILGFGIGLVAAIPQTVRSVRRSAVDGSAVSITAWSINAVSQACWLFFAVVVGDLTVTVSALVICCSSLLLVLIEARAAATRASGMPGGSSSETSPRGAGDQPGPAHHDLHPAGAPPVPVRRPGRPAREGEPVPVR